MPHLAAQVLTVELVVESHADLQPGVVVVGARDHHQALLQLCRRQVHRLGVSGERVVAVDLATGAVVAAQARALHQGPVTLLGFALEQLDQLYQLVLVDQRQILHRRVERCVLARPAVRLAGLLVHVERHELLAVTEDLDAATLLPLVEVGLRGDLAERLIRAVQQQALRRFADTHWRLPQVLVAPLLEHLGELVVQHVDVDGRRVCGDDAYTVVLST